MSERRELKRTLGELRQTHGDAVEKMQAIVSHAEIERREMTTNEAGAFERLKGKVTEAADQMRVVEQKIDDAPADPVSQFRQGRTEREARVGDLLSREQRMADLPPSMPSAFDSTEVEEFSLGRAIRGALTSDWRDADLERRALVEGTNSAGGFLTPEVLSSRIIDRVRKRARVLQAGAQTLRLDSDSVSLPRLTTGVTPAWRAENASNSESDPVFDRVTFVPKSLATAVKVSYELWEDMIDGGAEIITNELIAAIGLEVDRASLRGSGSSNQPTGLRNQSGVTIQSMGTNGAVPNYGSLMTAVGTILGANIDPTAAIMSSRTWMQLGGLADTTGQPLRPPKAVEDLTYLVSNQIPDNLTQGSSSVASEVYVGDFTNLIVGVKPFVRIDFQMRDRGAFGVNLKSSTEKLIDTQQIYVLATIRADVQLLHPEAFTVITGVLAS